MKYRIIICFIALAIISIGVQSQQRHNLYIEYIDKYNKMAVDQMKVYKIPASITLAQGLLESGAGQSILARKHHNHFGIKCGGNWKGRTARHDDDLPDECFRVYHSPKESYEDHSLFLRGRDRYALLFQLEITDYRGWAYGLKKAGYATAPKYAIQLIDIIENYELYKYDRKEKGASSKNIKIQSDVHQTYLSNDLVYIIVCDGDTFENIGKEFNISKKKLIKYNDLHKEYILTNGDIIYLHKKRKKAQKPYSVHTIEAGESMHTISQRYGIRLKQLYKMNHKNIDYVPEEGIVLKLR